MVFLVHLDELSNGKACSLDEVLVTPEMTFSNDCGILYYSVHKRNRRKLLEQGIDSFFLVPINDSPIISV